jgi:hypothetical protein
MLRTKTHRLPTRALFGLALLLACGTVGAQSFSNVLSFQGRLCGTDGKPLPDGPYVVQFTMYNWPTGGSALWTESQGVTQVGGVFIAYLGTVTPFPADLFKDGDRWLGIKVGGDPEMGDRIHLTPSPWAIYAADSNTVDGFHASSTPTPGYLLPLDGSGKFPASVIPPDDDWTISGSNIHRLTGNVGIGLSSPGYTLHVQSAGQRAVFADAVAHSGTNYGIYGRLSSTSGAGVFGEATTTTGTAHGVAGSTSNTDGCGVFGQNLNSSGDDRGVYGVAASSTAKGVMGYNSSSSGSAVGVLGRTNSTDGYGVRGEAPRTSGRSFGVYGDTASTDGIGVYGNASAASGLAHGGWFQTSSTSGWGAVGYALASSGATQGLHGESASTSGTGVYGSATASAGATRGVYGETHSSIGTGVYGLTTDSRGNAVVGENSNYMGYLGNSSGGAKGSYGANTYGYLGTSYAGVVGISDTGYGVRGSSSSSWGVLGVSPHGSGQAGVVGAIYLSNGAVSWVPNSGVSGSTESGYGVAGRTTSGIGVYGVQDNSNNKGYLGTTTEAVLGIAATGNAGRFQIADPANGSEAVYASTSGAGFGLYASSSCANNDTPAIYGEHAVSDYYGIGVQGVGGYEGVLGTVHAAGSSSYFGVMGWAYGGSGSCVGVYGRADGSGYNYGVYGNATSGTMNYAGYFAGNVAVSGTLSKGGGSFKIDYPLDPENKYLYHSFVESPDMMNVYNGNTTTDARGYATVTLPDWFGALNRDFRYQLTVLDEGDTDEFVLVKVVRKIADNQFTIRTSAPGAEVSWQVTGIRQDPFANAYRIPVEEWKPVPERGSYLHPELYGAPEERRVDLWLQPRSGKADARRAGLPGGGGAR